MSVSVWTCKSFTLCCCNCVLPTDFSGGGNRGTVASSDVTNIFGGDTTVAGIAGVELGELGLDNGGWTSGGDTKSGVLGETVATVGSASVAVLELRLKPH